MNSHSTAVLICNVSGATEGNASLINIDNKVGAVGFVFRTLPDFVLNRVLPVHVIRVDKVTGQPLRYGNYKGSGGRCIEAEAGQEGELVARIIRGDPVKDFQGYKDAAATEKKILRNVFKKGDAYFRSGDLVVMDQFGWVTFKDRCGDTFRLARFIFVNRAVQF